MRKKIDYAIILVDRLQRAKEPFVDLSVVAYESRLPYAFLEKVAQELKRAGLLESKRGAGGGYRLTKDAQSVTVATLLSLFERTYQVCPVLRGNKKGLMRSITSR